MKYALYILITLGLVFGIAAAVTQKMAHAPTLDEAINSFEDCVAAGYAVMESYPRQCRSSDGTLFVEEITGELPDSKKEAVEEVVIKPNSGVRGIVLRGPICPVQGDDAECSDVPFSTTINAYRKTSQNIVYTSAKSNEQGEYEIALEPGEYVIRAETADVARTCATEEVAVEADTFVQKELSCDSGIR